MQPSLLAYQAIFSESQYPDEAEADWWTKREIRSAQKIQHNSRMFAPTTKKCWFQQSRDFSKGSGSTDVCQELLRSTHRWLMNAEFYLLTFKIWIQMPLPLNISIAIYPGKCVPNRWLCQDSRINLLEVLNRPTADVDFWTAFLRGKDGWLQPLKLYATYSGVKQLSGKTKTTWNHSALVEVSWCYKSQPLASCSELPWLSNSSQV